MAEVDNDNAENEVNLSDTIQRLLSVLKRRRWSILTAVCCVPMAAIAILLNLPDHYISQATLLLVQQQISQRFVQPDSPTTAPSAIQAMKLEVLSRRRLIAIIDELGLYTAEKQNLSPQALAEKMWKDIEIEPLGSSERELTAFTISFTAPDARLAQEVTNRVTSLFIEQNLKNRGEQAARTTKFLSDQLDVAKQRMTDQEQRIESFKMGNLGELPDQQQTTLAALTDARLRGESISANISQLQQQQASLEAALGDRLTRLKSERAALLARFTAIHPEVAKKGRIIDRTKAAVEHLRAGDFSKVALPSDPDSEDPSVEGMLRQGEINAGQLASLIKQQERLKTDADQFQRRLNFAPVREQQLAVLLRDYNAAKQDYTDLLNKKTQSQLAGSIEENQQGQQFRLVNPPTLPEHPSSPKRLKVSLGAFAAGIFLGFALAFIADARDTSFHCEDLLRHSFSVPLILSIPLVRTTAEQRSNRLRTVAEWFAGCTMAIALFAAEIYMFRRG